MITISNLSKSYGAVHAIRNLSLEVKKGELFGLIGPDGAGKTTLLRILVTLILPEEGGAKLMNLDVVDDYKKIRGMIGYMPGRFSLYQDLSVEENLKFFATVFGTTIEENYDLIRDIYSQIEPFKKRRAGKLSGGMKQKLALSCALIHKPEILILDEPTTGVDAVSRKEFWEMLKKLQQKGITILVSTPYMDEANLCDRVALMQEGQFLAVDPPEEIVHQFETKIWAIQTDNMTHLVNDLRTWPQSLSAFAFGQYAHLTVRGNSLNETALIQYLEKKRHKRIEVKSIRPDIEDVFMGLMENGGNYGAK